MSNVSRNTQYFACGSGIRIIRSWHFTLFMACFTLRCRVTLIDEFQGETQGGKPGRPLPDEPCLRSLRTIRKTRQTDDDAINLPGIDQRRHLRAELRFVGVVQRVEGKGNAGRIIQIRDAGAPFADIES